MTLLGMARTDGSSSGGGSITKEKKVGEVISALQGHGFQCYETTIGRTPRLVLHCVKILSRYLYFYLQYYSENLAVFLAKSGKVIAVPYMAQTKTFTLIPC